MLPEKDDEGRQVFIFRLGNYVYCAKETSIFINALSALCSQRCEIALFAFPVWN